MNVKIAPPACPLCGAATQLTSRAAHPRRGERTVEVTFLQWECVARCAGPDGEVPFAFVDEVLSAQNEAATREAWAQRFGEALPPSGRPGRKPAERRTERVSLLLAPSELASIDAARGGLSRNEYIRRLALRASKAS